MKKLAIITSHPIQYYAPLFRLLAKRGIIQIKVFYTWSQSKDTIKYDPGFKKNVGWDIPLLDGYEYSFVNNISSEPGSHHFKGIDNPTIIAEIEAYGADAILVFGWAFKSHLKILRNFKGKKKVIFRGDSNLLDEPKGFSIRKLLRRIFLTWVYSNIDSALFVGTVNKKYYLKHGLKESQLIFAPHAIDNDRFIQQSITNKIIVAEKRAALGIKSADVVFLFAGKFETKKNPELLINAFINLNNINTQLVLIGNGIQEDELKKIVLAQSETIKNRIHFLPFQNQSIMPDIYGMADIFCLVSKGPGETWGLAVNEAMACAKAILVSDKCGCSEDVVINGENGYVVKNNDLVDLQHKMQLIIANNNFIEMGKKSYKKIESWNFEKISNSIESLVLGN